MTPPHITNPVPQMGLTENGSATFLTSGNPCLDLFFKVVPGTPAFYLHQQLSIAWAHNALTTLKLICNLRGVRGTGKSDKEGFYTAALWLHKHHPKTLAYNAESLAEFGYFKDLPEILYPLLEGSDVRETQRSEWATEKGERQREMKSAERQKKREKKKAERQRKESEAAKKAQRQTSESERKRKRKRPAGRIWRKDAPFREKMAAEKWELEKKKINEARLAKKIAMHDQEGFSYVRTRVTRTIGSYCRN